MQSLHIFGAEPASYVIPVLVFVGLLVHRQIAAFVGLN